MEERYTKEQLVEAFYQWQTDFVINKIEFDEEVNEETNTIERAQRSVDTLLSYLK